MVSREEIFADHVAHLVALLQCEIIDSPHENPHRFIEWLWLDDPGACERMLIDSIPEWKTFGDEIVDSIWLAAEHLDQDAFLTTVFNCSLSRGISRSHKMRLLALLLNKGYPKALGRYEKSFKAKTRSIQCGKTECIPSNIMPPVHEVCRLHVRSLVLEFRKIEEVCMPLVAKKQLWPYALHAAQAGIIMFEEGAERLREIASDDNVDPSFREQVVYCIGCLRDRDDLDFLQQLYWRRFDDSVFQLQSQVVDAVAYIGSPAEVSSFLVEAIDERMKSGKSWFRNVDRYLRDFIETAYYTAEETPALVERLLQLVETKDVDYVAAPAWVTLERLGHPVGRVPERLKGNIQVARNLIESLVVSDELKVHKRSL